MATSIGNLIATVGLQLGDLDRDIRNATGKLTKFASKLDSLGKDITMKITAPITAMGAASVVAFSQFEKGLAEVQTIAQATPADLEALGAGARKLSKDIGLNLTDTVNGLYEALSANIPQQNALSFLETASKAGIAGVTTTKTAVDGLTTAINAWKLPAEQATEVADKFFIAVRNGKVNFEQLSQSLGSIAPTAAAFGISLDDVLAGLATLTKQGVKPAEAFTQMKAAIVALAKPNKDMVALLESIGYASGSAAIKELGLVNALQLLRSSAGDLDTLTEALGSTEALGAATGLTGENLRTFQADLAAVGQSAGATQKAFEVMDATTSARLAKLKATLTDLAVTIGEKLVPILQPLVDKALALANSFGQLDAGTQANIVNAALFAATLGPVLILVAKVGTAVATLIGWVGGLGSVWGAVVAVGGALLTVLDFLAITFGSLTLGIAAAGLALGIYLSDFELFKTAGTELGNVIWGAYQAVQDFGNGLLSFLKSPIETAKGWIDGLMRSFLELIGVIDSADTRLRNAQAGEGPITRARRLGLNGLADSMTDDYRGARATGGPVSAGSSYMVGEHGPELFTPGVSGRIANHRDTAAALGGGSGPTIHLHLTAGVASEVRAEVTAMLPSLSRAITQALAGQATTSGPMGRILRTGAA